jgi:hypothetical protein
MTKRVSKAMLDERLFFGVGFKQKPPKMMLAELKRIFEEEEEIWRRHRKNQGINSDVEEESD